MLRLIHLFDLKPGKDEEAFLGWLDTTMFQKAKEFGCIERKNWIYLDGLEDPYGKGKRVRKRPKYINEAFWKSQKAAEDFRRWLMSPEGAEHRRTWMDGVKNHSVLRYIDHAPHQNVGDD